MAAKILGPPGFDFSQVNALKFAEIWNHFDTDKSGYIEGKELDDFIYQLGEKMLQKTPNDDELKSLKRTLMSAYDLERNGKISMVELARMLLPNEEIFLLLFRRSVPLQSSVKFMEKGWVGEYYDMMVCIHHRESLDVGNNIRNDINAHLALDNPIWRKYDTNYSGYLTVKELENFVKDFVMQSGELIDPKKIKEYASSIMELYDKNEDGLLDLKDMARLLNLTDNFLLRFRIEDSSQEERKRDFLEIFKHYDMSGTGALEGVEIDGFVKDMMETIRGPLSAQELAQFKEAVMKHSDKNRDGKIQRGELAICLGIHLK